MFALNLIQLPRLIAVGLAVGFALVAIVAVALAIFEPAFATTYGYYRRP